MKPLSMQPNHKTAKSSNSIFVFTVLAKYKLNCILDPPEVITEYSASSAQLLRFYHALLAEIYDVCRRQFFCLRKFCSINVIKLSRIWE